MSNLSPEEGGSGHHDNASNEENSVRGCRHYWNRHEARLGFRQASLANEQSNWMMHSSNAVGRAAHGTVPQWHRPMLSLAASATPSPS